MSRKQANHYLYMVSFLSLLSIIIMIVTLPSIWKFVLINKSILFQTIGSLILLALLVISPLIKKNIILVVTPLLCFWMDLPSSVQGIYGYLMGTDVLVQEGIFPGILIYTVFVLTCVTGLFVLLLRCYGYIKEHRAGLKTSF